MTNVVIASAARTAVGGEARGSETTAEAPLQQGRGVHRGGPVSMQRCMGGPPELATGPDDESAPVETAVAAAPALRNKKACAALALLECAEAPAPLIALFLAASWDRWRLNASLSLPPSSPPLASDA